MPTYQYTCKMCGHLMEEFQSITEPPLVHCPKCKTDNLVRSIGAGAGLIFKGSGFYLTDYKKNSKSWGGPSEKKTDSSTKETKKEG
jgi:putative FmdB family regulatory protein